MHGTFGDADGFGDFAVADLDHSVAALRFGGQPEIDEEGDGAAVVADQVAHQDVDYVIVEGEHRYSNYYYSIDWLIAAGGGRAVFCAAS